MLSNTNSSVQVFKKWTNSFVWPTDAILVGQSGPGSNGNEWVLHISKSSRTRASPLFGLMKYPGHSLKESCSSAEMQIYSTADRAFISVRILQSVPLYLSVLRTDQSTCLLYVINLFLHELYGLIRQRIKCVIKCVSKIDKWITLSPSL